MTYRIEVKKVHGTVQSTVKSTRTVKIEWLDVTHTG
jgi:hypothetical protein